MLLSSSTLLSKTTKAHSIKVMDFRLLPESLYRPHSICNLRSLYVSLISVTDQTSHEFSLHCFNVIYNHVWEHFANGHVLNHQHANTGTCSLEQSKLC